MSLGNLFYQLETDILIKIAELIAKGKFTDADYQIKLLAQIGTLNQEVIALVRKYRADAINMTRAQVKQAAQDMLEQVNSRLPKTVPSPGGWFENTVNVWVRTAATQMDLSMSTLAANAGRVYSDIVARGALTVLAGSNSRFDAMVQSVRQWAQAGIPTFVDKSGREWSAEATANMVIRSNQRRVATQIMFDRGDQAGTDLIEVSSHMGARPGCAPYQGRIYSRNGTSQNYPPLSSTTYGQPSGLFGINCRHVAYPFFPGLSEQRNEPTPGKTNAEAYKQSQMQRGLERNLRAADREYRAVKALGPQAKDQIEAAKLKKSIAEDQMNQFIYTTGRTRRYNREKAIVY